MKINHVQVRLSVNDDGLDRSLRLLMVMVWRLHYAIHPLVEDGAGI